MDSKVVRADFGSGLICHRAQTCCALKYSAPSGARQDNCADLLGLQTRRGSNHSTAHVGESNSRSNVFRSIAHLFACPGGWKVLSGEFRRRPTALAKKLVNRIVSVAEDCLSPERTFHGCSLMYIRGLIPWLDSVARFQPQHTIKLNLAINKSTHG